jgi:hypothetical protein
VPRRRRAFAANVGQPRATINAARHRLLPGLGEVCGADPGIGAACQPGCRAGEARRWVWLVGGRASRIIAVQLWDFESGYALAARQVRETVSSFATGAGTLVLAVATFWAVRSSNRSARIAEESLLAGLRPLLLQSRAGDPEQKVLWQDRHAAHLGGGGPSSRSRTVSSTWPWGCVTPVRESPCCTGGTREVTRRSLPTRTPICGTSVARTWICTSRRPMPGTGRRHPCRR